MKTQESQSVSIKNNLIKTLFIFTILLSINALPNLQVSAQTSDCKDSELISENCICKKDGVSKKEDFLEGFSTNCVKNKKVEFFIKGKSVTQEEFSSGLGSMLFTEMAKNSFAEGKSSAQKTLNQTFEDFKKDIKLKPELYGDYPKLNCSDQSVKDLPLNQRISFSRVNGKGYIAECKSDDTLSIKYFLEDKEVSEEYYSKDTYKIIQELATTLLSGNQKGLDDLSNGIIQTCFSTDPEYCKDKNMKVPKSQTLENKKPVTKSQSFKSSSFKKPLKFSSKDSQVKVVQDILYSKGYLKNKSRGYYGKATVDAVKNYQKDNNLIVTGIVGKVTFNNLINNINL